MNQRPFRFTRKKCFSFVCFLVCLKCPVISGIRTPGPPIPEQSSVSDDFTENPMDHALVTTTKVASPNDALQNIGNRNYEDIFDERIDGENERQNNIHSSFNAQEILETHDGNREIDDSNVEGPRNNGVINMGQYVTQNFEHIRAGSLECDRGLSRTNPLKQGTRNLENLIQSTGQLVQNQDDSFFKSSINNLFQSQNSGYHFRKPIVGSLNRIRERSSDSISPQNTKKSINKIELDKTLSELNQLNDEVGLDKTPDDNRTPRQKKLAQQRHSLQNVVLKFQHLKDGDFPELHSDLKLYIGQRKSETEEPGNNQTQGASEINAGDKGPQDGASEDVKQVADLSQEEKRIRLRDFLNKLEEAHQSVKKQSNSDIHSPPGINIDHDNRRRVKRKLRLLRTDKGAFELSVNHGYHVFPRDTNHNSSTSYQDVHHRDLMRVTRAVDRKPLLRTNHQLRLEVAQLEIRPFTGIGHCENELFFGSRPAPLKWTDVPSHYTYLGLINTPEKFKTTEMDRRILSHYNIDVLRRLHEDLYEGDLVEEEKGEAEKMEEEDYKVDGQEMKGMQADDLVVHTAARGGIDDLER